MLKTSSLATSFNKLISVSKQVPTGPQRAGAHLILRPAGVEDSQTRLLTDGRPAPPPLDAFPSPLAAKCPSKKTPQMWSWGLAAIPGEGSFSGAPSLTEARLPAANLSFVYFQAIKNDSLISLTVISPHCVWGDFSFFKTSCISPKEERKV